MVSERYNTIFFAVCFFFLLQLNAACLVVDDGSIRGFVNQYTRSFPSYDANHPNCPIGSWDTSNVTDMSFLFFERFSFNSEIDSWDTQNVVNMSHMFSDAFRFTRDLNSWKTGNVVDMSFMFNGAHDFNGNISSWNTSNVVDMSSMFENAFDFNGNIGSWDTGKVVDMSYMLKSTHALRISDLSSWNTQNVVNMTSMFEKSFNFNSDLSSWNTQNVVTMVNMFNLAFSFNSDLNSWDTSKVVDMSSMFEDNFSFNGDISSWSTISCVDMSYMFAGASSFSSDISSWQTSKVVDFSSMFLDASSFNSDLSSWNTSNVVNFAKMFKGSSSFNQPIGTWSTNKVTSMRSMFDGAISFDQPLNAWDTSNVILMNNMFRNARSYNQPLDAWNTSKVQLMSSMFEGATVFDQPLGSWSTKEVVGMKKMFQNARSFDQQLDRWDVRNVRILSRMFFNAVSFKQSFCWELDNKIFDDYLTGTNGTAVNEWEAVGTCSPLNLVTEENENNEVLVGVLSGSSIVSVMVVAVVVKVLRSRIDAVKRTEVPLLEVKINCLKVGFGSLTFVLATYILLTVIATNAFAPDIIEGSIAADVEQGFSFTLVGDRPNVYQVSLEEGKKYVIQVSPNFDGFATLYDSELKVVSRMINTFETNLDQFFHYDGGSPVYFPSPPICGLNIGFFDDFTLGAGLRTICPVREFHYNPYFRNNDQQPFGQPPILVNGQNDIQPSTSNYQFYTPSGKNFGAESYSDKHYLEIKSESSLLVNGDFHVSEFVTIKESQPISDNLKGARLSNFYELNVIKDTLYEVSITGDDSDAMYIVLLNKDGERLGQSHNYPAHFEAPTVCVRTSGCGDIGYPIAPSSLSKLQNKLFFEAEATGTLILRVFIGTEHVGPFTGESEPNRKFSTNPLDEYEERWVDGSRTLQPFTITYTPMKKATNAAILNFNEGRNAKTLVEVNIESTVSIIYSQIETIEYVAIFDTKGMLIASIDVSDPDDFMVGYEQIETLIVQSGSEKIWLEFSRGNKFPEIQNVSIEITPTVLSTESPTSSPATGGGTPSSGNSAVFVDPENQYASCEPNPEVLTLQGTCLDGVLYYCRNDKYPEDIRPEDIGFVPAEELSEVCTCVEFICSVVPSGDADFTLYLEYFHLAEAIILAPAIIASGLLTVFFICASESRKIDNRIVTSVLLVVSFSFAFIQDVLQYKLVQTAQLFRDIENVYVPVSERNTSLEGDLFLNTVGIELIRESEISEDYIRNISLAGQVFYVLANLFAILIFLNICLHWASTAYTATLGRQEERRKRFNRFKMLVRSLELLLFSYSLYFTIKIITDPSQYDNSLSVMEFSACCLIVVGYVLSIFLLLPKLLGMSSRAKDSSQRNDLVSSVLKSVTSTSTGIIVCLLGVTIGHYYAIVEVKDFEDLLRARNDVSISGVFLAQHLCQIAAQGWILLDLIYFFTLQRAQKRQSEDSSFFRFLCSPIYRFIFVRPFQSENSSEEDRTEVTTKHISL